MNGWRYFLISHCAHGLSSLMSPVAPQKLLPLAHNYVGQSFCTTALASCWPAMIRLSRHQTPCRVLTDSARMVGSLLELKTNIWNGHGYIVSDGSYRTEARAAAWIIEGCSANSRVIGTMLTPGNPKDHSSFRSEWAGIYGALCTLESLELGKVPFHCRFACDGKLALDRLKSTHPILPMEPHADLLQAIKSKEAQAGLTVHWCYVKGHQDGKTPTILSQDAWLNIKADLLAKATVNLEHHSPTQYRLLGEGWICCINQQRVVKQLVDTI